MIILWHTEPCTTNGVSERGPSKRPGTGEECCSNKVTVEQEKRPDSTPDNHEHYGRAHTLSKMNVEAFKMFYRNINSGGTNVHDTSEKGTTKPKGYEFYMMQFSFLPFHS